MIYDSIDKLIGNTPIVKLDRLFPNYNIFCKLEIANPSGSFKDRVALNIIENAEKNNLLKPGDTILEASSGNTAISIAMIAKLKGYNVVIYIPKSASQERKKILKFLGAELKEVDSLMLGIQEIKQICNSNNSFYFRQFTNQLNIEAHYKTAEEIWNDMGGKIDVLVAGSGTGGLITGIQNYIIKKNSNFKVIKVEPSNSAKNLKNSHISRLMPKHRLEGISVDIQKNLLDPSVSYLNTEITDEEAFYFCRKLAQTEGIMAGITTGAYLAAIDKNLSKFSSLNVLTIAADRLDRYFSTDLFSN